jgi:N-hydroxyarylamine O-acetyltransferase
MNVEDYLKRIRYRGSRSVSTETVRDLHRAHMYTVPFENLDIHAGRPIVLQDEALFEKIVSRKRGGFCYELNGLFCWLLRELGFEVSKLSARAGMPNGSFGPNFDHMTLLVELERPWIADVGFGDSFVEPLALEMQTPQFHWGRSYRLVPFGEEILYQSFDEKSGWQNGYLFGLTHYEYSDYEEMCRFHQTSPKSPFTQKRICSRATPEGRITLSNLKWIETRGAQRNERILQDENEYKIVLQEFFGVSID